MAQPDPHIEPVLHYLSEYQIIICSICQYALNNVARHLQREHKLPKARCTALVESVKGHSVVSPSTVPRPSAVIKAITYLQAPVPAYSCSVVGCKTIYSSRPRIQKHARVQHEWRSGHTPIWRRIPTQKFFPKHQQGEYFEVRVESSTTIQDNSLSPVNQVPSTQPRPSLNPEQHGDLDVLEEQWQAINRRRQEEEAVMQDDILKQDRTGWWTLTQWPEHFRGRNLQYLAHAGRVADQDEHLLREANRICDFILRAATAKLTTYHRETRRWLRSAKASEIDRRPLARLADNNSQDRYYGYWRRFICYSLRVWENMQGDDHEAALARGSVGTGVRVELPPRSSRSGNHATPANPRPSPLSDEDSDEYDNCDTSDESDGSASDSADDIQSQVPVRLAGSHSTGPEPVSETATDPMKDARELFPWTDEQKRRISSLYTELSQNNDPDDADRTQELGDLMKALCQTFIFQQWDTNDFECALVHYCAVLGIDSESNRLRKASDYSYMVAGVVWCVRVLAADILMPDSERIGTDFGRDSRDKLMEGRRLFLTDGEGCPMSTILTWLAYGKYITMNSGNEGAMLWSADKQVLIYRGARIELTQFREAVQNTVQRATDMLWKDLMWVESISDRFEVVTALLEDDVSFTQRGYSFMQRHSNQLSADGLWMRRRMVEQTDRNRRLRHHRQWVPPNVRRWLRKCDRFLELLLVCIHITGGQPARGTEIMACRFRNGHLQDRNVFIIDGQVAVVTRYHKSQSQLDRPKVIPRFLPRAVAQLLVVYLVHVQPFREFLAVQVDGQAFTDHIWHNKEGPWETTRLTKTLQHATGQELGHRFGTLDYRHIAVSIGREVVGARFAAGYQDEIGEGEVEEPEVDDNDGLELQSGRGELQGSLRYGVPVDIVQHMSARSIETFRPLSEAWHRFLGLAPALRPVRSSSRATSIGSRKRPMTSDDEDHEGVESSRGRAQRRDPYLQSPLALRPRALMPSSPPVPRGLTSSPPAPVLGYFAGGLDEDTVLVTLRRLMKDDEANFRSNEQREAMMAVMRQEHPLVVVLPTGGGKTLLATLPAFHHRDGVAIFVAPFRALVNNMVDRFRREGLTDACEWRHGMREPASMIVVSADIAVSSSFVGFAQLMHSKGLLRTVYFDEVHLAFTANDWRPKLEHLQELRTLPCQHVFLTATLPPTKVIRLEVNLALSNARHIRAATTRPRIRYFVQRCKPQDLFPRTIELVQRRQAHFAEQTAGAKGVVYAKSRADCEALAEELKCPFYHAKDIQRSEKLEQWLLTGGFIVATSALGTGVDYPGIVFTLHMDIPYTIIDFAQESGRAGRGGEDVDSVIVAPEHSAEQQLRGDQSQGSSEKSAMLEFVATTTCRRKEMSMYLDGLSLARSCSEIAGAARCDRCGEGETAVTGRRRTAARQWDVVRGLLDELTTGCVVCYMLNHDDPAGWRTHHTSRCREMGETETFGEKAMDEFRARVRWTVSSHTCHRCGVSQRYCATGEDVRQVCQWPQVVIPMMMALWQYEERARVTALAGGEWQERWADPRQFEGWIGERHGSTVWQEWMSNGMVMVIRLLLLHHRSELMAGGGDAEALEGWVVEDESLERG